MGGEVEQDGVARAADPLLQVTERLQNCGAPGLFGTGELAHIVELAQRRGQRAGVGCGKAQLIEAVVLEVIDAYQERVSQWRLVGNPWWPERGQRASLQSRARSAGSEPQEGSDAEADVHQCASVRISSRSTPQPGKGFSSSARVPRGSIPCRRFRSICSGEAISKTRPPLPRALGSTASADPDSASSNSPGS